MIFFQNGNNLYVVDLPVVVVVVLFVSKLPLSLVICVLN